MIDKSKIIAIKIRQKVLSYIEGTHKALTFGEEDDLKNIREYTYGDNVNRINWIITAKEKKPYIVEREELKSQNIIVSLLLDQNILFKNKLEKLSEIFAIIGYSAFYQQDRLDTYIFTDKMEKFFKYRKSPKLIEEILDYIFSLKLNEKNIDTSLLNKFLLRHKRSLLVLIGDFVYPIELLQLSKKHKVVLISVREIEEENPEKYIGFQLKSFDKKKNIPNLISPMVKKYKERLKEIDENLRQFTVLNKIPYKKIYTNENPFLKLRALFS